MNKCIIICGHTASGKSNLAVHLALLLKKLGIKSEIISADSRQVYKGLDISSAKITPKEMKDVRHHMLSIVSPQVGPVGSFSVSEYKEKARKIITGIHKKGSIPIVCGGTGMYIDNLVFEKTIPEVPPNPKLRAKLEKLNTEELYKILKKKDPKRAITIDSKNKHRLIRALEIIEKIGKVPAASPNIPVYDNLFIGLYIDKEELEKVVQKRTRERMRAGLVKEIENLHKNKKLSYERLVQFGFEYKWVSLYLQKKITKKECIESINKDTISYVRRQMTWFKKNKNINWLNTSNKKETFKKAEEKVLDFIK